MGFMYKPLQANRLFACAVMSIKMNCIRCHHTYQAHEKNSPKAKSILLVGKCLVPGCDCPHYVDKIETIDEDLL